MIENGHRYEDILNYTYGQFIAFNDAVLRRKREESALLLSLILTGSRGGEDSVTDMFDLIQKGK